MVIDIHKSELLKVRLQMDCIFSLFVIVVSPNICVEWIPNYIVSAKTNCQLFPLWINNIIQNNDKTYEQSYVCGGVCVCVLSKIVLYDFKNTYAGKIRFKQYHRYIYCDFMQHFLHWNSINYDNWLCCLKIYSGYQLRK